MTSPRFVAFALGSVLAGCTARQKDNCALRVVPAAAKITLSHGVDFASYPDPLPEHYSGCQNMWIGDGHDRRSMQLLSTAKFLDGRVEWLSGHEKDVEFRCVYREGVLVTQESLNPENCPTADEVEHR